MPKVRTKRTLHKRVKVSKTGKILHARSGKSHLLTGKGRKRKRRLSRSATFGKTTTRTVRSMLSP
jgi:large subunit ribosomal protein L35